MGKQGAKAPKLRGRKGKLLLKHRRQVSRFHMSGELLAASADWMGDVYVWRMWDKEPVVHIKDAHTDRAQGAALFDGQTKVVSCGFDAAIKVWDVATQECLQEHLVEPVEQMRVWDVQVSPGQQWLLASIPSRPSAYRLFPIEGGRVHFEGYTSYPSYAGFVPGEETLWQLHSDESFAMSFHTPGETEENRRFALPLDSFCPAFSGDGQKVAFRRMVPKKAQQEQLLEIYSVTDGALLHQISLGTKWHYAEALSLSHDGTWLAGLIGFSVMLWHVPSGEQVMPEDAGHTDHASAVAFALDDTTLVSAGWDRTLRCWDLQEILAQRSPKPARGASKKQKQKEPVAKEPTPGASKKETTPGGADADWPETFEAPVAIETLPEAFVLPPVAQEVPDTKDPDELFLAGAYTHALAYYSPQRLSLKGVDGEECLAYHLLDLAMCYRGLGDDDMYRMHYSHAQDKLNTVANLFNRYAWVLFENGVYEKALWVSAFGMQHFDSYDYRHTLHTYLSVLDALGDNESLLPQLACFRVEYPDFSDAKGLYEKHHGELEAFWELAPSDRERAWMLRYLARNDVDWEASARLARQLVSKDEAFWNAAIPWSIEQMRHSYSPALENERISCMTDHHLQQAFIYKRLLSWLGERIQYDSFKPAMRGMFHDYFREGKAPKGFFGKLLKAANKRPYSTHFVDRFVWHLRPPPHLQKKLFYVGACVDKWGMLRHVQSEEEAAIIRTIHRFRQYDADGLDGTAVFLEMLGVVLSHKDPYEDEEAYAKHALSLLLKDAQEAVFSALPLCSDKALPGLIRSLWRHDPDASIPALLAAATSSGKRVHRVVILKLREHEQGAQHVLPLLTHKKQGVRQLAVEVLVSHNREQDHERLQEALATETAASVREWLEKWGSENT